MPKIQACRNQCGAQIYTKEDPVGSGRWKPFDASTDQLHDCPKSEFNLKKQQGDSYRTPKPSSISDFEARVLDKLDLIEKKLDAVYSGRALREEDEGRNQGVDDV